MGTRKREEAKICSGSSYAFITRGDKDVPAGKLGDGPFCILCAAGPFDAEWYFHGPASNKATVAMVFQREDKSFIQFGSVQTLASGESASFQGELPAHTTGIIKFLWCLSELDKEAPVDLEGIVTSDPQQLRALHVYWQCPIVMMGEQGDESGSNGQP